MLGSLRFKLIASYFAVIFLCLFLAGSTIVILLRDYQQQIRLDQLADQSFFVSWTVRQLENRGDSPQQIALQMRALSESMGVRIVLAERDGSVIEDTSGDLDGEQITLPSWEGDQRRTDSLRAYYASREGGLFMIAPVARATGSRYVPIVAVPQASVAAAWWELAPRLSVAAVISLVVSVLVALLLGRSIARPLLQMTHASEEMAHGRYNQSIPVRGRDEIARLASAFNAMARQVASSDRTMRDFLANVSHELKTPLTSIQGFSQAMLDGTARSDDEQRHAAGVINQEAQAMRRLVEDLLTLSKIESGQIAMDRDLVRVDALLRDALRRTEWQVEDGRIDVTLEAQTGATVRGDAHWLGQVFSNLLDNAIKHTPDWGRISVRAAIRREPDEVVVSFHNTGSHIPTDDLPRVFERFFQVDRSRSDRAGGSGLGLAIVREVVQAHGGTVEAESAPAAGTTFRVRLPLHGLSEPGPAEVLIGRVA